MDRWTTDDDLAAARERFAAQVPGYRPPAAYALARRDPGGLVFGHVNAVGAARGLPAAALAVACGYVDRSGGYPLTAAQVRDVLRRLAPAEAATHVGHPNTWSWRALLDDAQDDDHPFVACYLAEADDRLQDPEQQRFAALAHEQP